MDDKYVVKDSGVRQEYKSGMRRDTQDGKPNYRLIDIAFLTRLAWHLTKGAVKYGRDNWRLACSQEELERFQDSGLRHHMQYLAGEMDEDHGMAVVFNIMAAEHCRAKLANLDKPADHVDEPDDITVSELRVWVEFLTASVAGKPFVTVSVEDDSIRFNFTWLSHGKNRMWYVSREELLYAKDRLGLIKVVGQSISEMFRNAIGESED